MTGGSGRNNFHDYIVTRMSGMLPIDVHIVPSGDPPTGVGEPGLPPMTPAIANAIHALIGNPAQSSRPGSGEHTGGGPVGGGVTDRSRGLGVSRGGW